ncbi:MAG: HlyD family efflux transporter periplasmic adaptor subunit [Magnetococcales bacterium]|nr:HlyD family efflux transporter periplasmic adaptor subunit [Magnetococcales bacterium]
MMATASGPLPKLRQEVILRPAPPARDGSPSWTLADPGRNHFFRIDWVAFEILSRWHEGNVSRILERIAQETTLDLEERDVTALSRFLADNHLTRSVHPAGSRRLAHRVTSEKGPWLQWLLHHYLFFRIPLVRPDSFLDRTLPWVAPFFSLPFLWVMIGLAGIDVFLLLRQWDHFQATLLAHLGLNSLFGYGLTLMAVKSIHELGHAYTAKQAGCRVPTMGVAFLVLLPMLYTDTTEAWKLDDRRRRLAIASGGVVAEGGLAVLALLAWNVLPGGSARDIAFWIATTSLATTLAINLSPFMRFDGYFVLSDALDLANLHQRAFDMGRWWLRKLLFNPMTPPPEQISPVMTRFLVVFAVATWMYRLLLFLGIALLVYHFFIKVVGIALFAVEIGWFILLPLGRELKKWPGVFSQARSRLRLPLLVSGLMALALWPWSGHITAPALLQGEALVHLYAPRPARLAGMDLPPSGTVVQGQALFVLDAPELEHSRKLHQVRLDHAERERAIGGLDLDWARRVRVAQGERERSAASLAGIQSTLERLILSAPFAGTLVDVSPDLAVGTWLRSGEHLATVIRRERFSVDAFLAEEVLKRVGPEAKGWFIADVAEMPPIAIQRTSTETMGITDMDEPLLASLFGGPVKVVEQNGLLVPEEALFRIRLQGTGASMKPPLRQRGVVHLEAHPQSLARRWGAMMLMVLVREWKM